MQLSRLRVKNIRSYESADLEFRAGTTLLVGDVGAGKTSLLYAIEMALFGVAEVNAAYLVRHGAGHAEVTVGFQGPDHRYEISRRFRRLRRKGQETFEAERIRFMVDGAETAYSATELRQQVIDLLGFPDNPSPQAHSDLWRWAVYVPQERMRDILGARPQERLETVRKALGVERYRTAAENAQVLATDLRRTASTRRAEADRLRHFDEEFAEGHRQADQLRADRVTIDRGLRDRRKVIQDLEAGRDAAEAAARTAEADARELAGLTREAETDQGTLEGHLRTLSEHEAEAKGRTEERATTNADADALDTRRGELAITDEELGAVRTDVERRAEVLRALAGARAALASAERREGETRAAVDRLRSEEEDARHTVDEALGEGPSKEPPAPVPDSLTVVDERLEAARRAEAVCLQELTQAESALSEVEELLRGGVCPRCHQAVRPSEFAEHRTEAAAVVEGARGRLTVAETARRRIEEERRARERYERALERWKEVEKRRSATRTAHERATRALTAATKELEEAEAATVDARTQVAKLSPEESEDSRARAKLTSLERLRAERARSVEQSLLAVERREGIDRALKALRVEKARLSREVTTLQRRIEGRGRRMNALLAVRGDAEALRTAATEANRRLSAAQEEEAEERAAVARLDARLEEAVRRVRDAEAGRRERAELIAEAKEVDDKAAWVGTAFRTTVLEMEQKLLTHAQALFEREFSRYFASLVDDPGLVARTDPAFTPLVMIEGEWTPAEALSGGERTSLALAFRLALAQVVRAMGSLHLDTLLLDEPTDGFSPEQVIRMGELLEELALPQVILVSHESQLAAIADRVIRVRKVDGRSVLDTSSVGTRDSSEDTEAEDSNAA